MPKDRDSIGSASSGGDACADDITEDVITFKKPTRRGSSKLAGGEQTASGTVGTDTIGTLGAVAADKSEADANVAGDQDRTVALLSLSKSKRARKGLRLGSSKLRGGAMRVCQPVSEEPAKSAPDSDGVLEEAPSNGETEASHQVVFGT